MIRQISHLCFDTDNLPAMVAFYETLGLTKKFPFLTKDGQTFGYYLTAGNSTFLELFDRTLKSTVWGNGAPPATPLTKGTQYVHLCFEITGLQAFKAKLEQRGVKVGPISTGMSKALAAWTSDPDGNTIELLEYTSESLHIQPSNP